MRRVIGALAIVVMMSVAAVGRAGAATTSRFHQAVSGQFSGTSVFAPAPSCHFFHQVFDATYLANRRSTGSFHLAGCTEFSPVQENSFAGSFVLTTPNRAVLGGTVSGIVGNGGGPCSPGLIPGSLNFTLVLARGTKEFRHQSGTIHLAGSWCSPALPDVPGPINGVVRGQLP
jgi:hypothetical protein